MNIEREFHIAGVRHHDYCNDKNRNVDFKIEINENLIFEKDFNNKHDKYAVKVINKENKVLGLYLFSLAKKQVKQLIVVEKFHVF